MQLVWVQARGDGIIETSQIQTRFQSAFKLSILRLAATVTEEQICPVIYDIRRALRKALR